MGGLLSLGRSMGRTNTWLTVIILGFAFLTRAALPSPELRSSIKSLTRNPRLFYVSSTTYTSFATSRCYIATATAACKRKRRNLVADQLERQLDQLDVEEENVERDAKMMLYWVTTTTTTTSYTATSTLATLACVPGGWEMNACG